MSDTPTPPASMTPSTDPAPSTEPPRRWDWRPKARWFAAEIVVVVAGILIALALNAWWADVQAGRWERQALADLRAELESNRVPLDQFIALYDRRAKLAESLMTDPDSILALSPAEQSRAFGFLTYSPTFDPNDAYLSSLVLAGQLGRIQDADARILLAQWVDANADLTENWAALQALAEPGIALSRKHTTLRDESQRFSQAWANPDQTTYYSAFASADFGPISPAMRRFLLDPAFRDLAAEDMSTCQELVAELRQVAAALDATVAHLDAQLPSPSD